MLRPLLEKDFNETYLGWLNDPEVNRYLEVRFIKSTIKNTRKFVRSFDNKDKFIFGIYTLNKKQHIGNIALYTNNHNIAHFGYLIGEKDYWGTRAAVEAVTLLLDFAFNKLNIRKVWGGVYLNNISSIFNCKKLGFVQEGRLRKHYTDHGNPTDSLIFGILREEWLSRG